jgi:hypothetical protein
LLIAKGALRYGTKRDTEMTVVPMNDEASAGTPNLKSERAKSAILGHA